MRLRIDLGSVFFREWQAKAAASKIGKKRPAQADVMRRNHRDGKFKFTAERRRAMSDRSKKQWATIPHPRGSLGMKHTAEALRKISAASTASNSKRTKAEWMAIKRKSLATRILNGTYSPNKKRGSWKAGWREIGGTKKYYRSRWEANYARVLERLRVRGEIKSWAHESDVFWFEGVNAGCVSYLPDFRVVNSDDSVEFHEVKGWMDAASKEKIQRMAKYHPSTKLVVVDSRQYKKLHGTLSAEIEGWE